MPSSLWAMSLCAAASFCVFVHQENAAATCVRAFVQAFGKHRTTLFARNAPSTHKSSSGEGAGSSTLPVALAKAEAFPSRNASYCSFFAVCSTDRTFCKQVSVVSVYVYTPLFLEPVADLALGAAVFIEKPALLSIDAGIWGTES